LAPRGSAGEGSPHTYDACPTKNELKTREGKTLKKERKKNSVRPRRGFVKKPGEGRVLRVSMC